MRPFSDALAIVRDGDGVPAFTVRLVDRTLTGPGRPLVSQHWQSSLSDAHLGDKAVRILVVGAIFSLFLLEYFCFSKMSIIPDKLSCIRLIAE